MAVVGAIPASLPPFRLPSLDAAAQAGKLEQQRDVLAEQKLAVDEAKQKERALVLSSRLASIGTLAAGVAACAGTAPPPTAAAPVAAVAVKAAAQGSPDPAITEIRGEIAIYPYRFDS